MNRTLYLVRRSEESGALIRMRRTDVPPLKRSPEMVEAKVRSPTKDLIQSERERECVKEEMDDSIRSYCNSMASFCNHLQSSCDALKTSIDRRPIPLATASSTFIHSLNRRVSAASAHLNLLETMSFDTVSFEELLGHCNEVFKDNKIRLLHLQDRLQPFGYVPEIEIDEDDDVSTPITEQDASDAPEDDDDLLDESLSLKKLGLSDASLSTLAFQANARNEDQDVSFPSKDSSGASGDGSLSDSGEAEDKQMITLAPLQLVKVCRDDYECLPSYMKSLAPWEDLLAAVEKISSGLKQKTSGGNFFHQDEISSLDLGPKARSYLLLLCTNEPISC